MEHYAPYLIMFLAGTLVSLFDIHARHPYSVLVRYRCACLMFGAAMGILGMFFFWAVSTLGILHPQLSPVTASIVLFLGYRLLILSRIAVFKVGGATKELGLAWLYEGLMFLFVDYIKSKESDSATPEFAALPLCDLVVLAKQRAGTAEDAARVEQISKLKDPDFKKNWLARFCASRGPLLDGADAGRLEPERQPNELISTATAASGDRSRRHR